MEELDTSSKEPQYLDLSRDEMWEQLSLARNARSDQDKVLWTSISIFWAANALLLGALFSTGKVPDKPLVGIIISAAGLVISLMMHGLQTRALGHTIRLEEVARKIEGRLRIEPALTLNAGGKECASRYLRPPSARKLMEICSSGVAILWVLSLVIFALGVA